MSITVIILTETMTATKTLVGEANAGRVESTVELCMIWSLPFAEKGIRRRDGKRFLSVRDIYSCMKRVKATTPRSEVKRWVLTMGLQATDAVSLAEFISAYSFIFDDDEVDGSQSAGAYRDRVWRDAPGP